MKSILLYLVAMFSTSTSDESFLNSCPKVNVIKAFEVKKFVGVWYQFAISGDLFNDPCEKSVTLDWALSGGGKNITITTYRICSQGMICRRKQTIWKAELGDPDEKTGQIEGKLNLSVKRPDVEKATVELLVLNTDYVSSAVLYTCSVRTNRTMAIWILTRKQKPTDMEMADILTTVDATLETNHLDDFEFRVTNPTCESVVKNNSKADKHIIEQSTMKDQNLPKSSSNISTTLNINSGIHPNHSNSANDIENKQSTAFTQANQTSTIVKKEKNQNLSPERSVIETHKNNSIELNKTFNTTVDTLSRTEGKVEQMNQTIPSLLDNSLTQTLSNNIFNNNVLNRNSSSNYNKGKDNSEKNVLYSVLENLLKPKSTNNSITSISLNRTLSSNGSILSGKGAKEKSGKHVLHSVLQNLIKQQSTNASVTNVRLNRTLNSNVGMINSNNDMEKSEKNLLYSALENLLSQISENNNTTSNRPNKLPDNKGELSKPKRKRKLSRQEPGMIGPEQISNGGNNSKENSETNLLYSALENLIKQNSKNSNIISGTLNKLPNNEGELQIHNRNGNLSKHKTGTTQPEQNVPHLLSGHSLEDNPNHDHYNRNGFSSVDDNVNCPRRMQDLQHQEVPQEGFLPSLARQAFFNYIPRAFNFDFWHF